MTALLGTSILFSSNFDVSLDFVSGNIEILGKQNRCFPRGESLNVCYSQIGVNLIQTYKFANLYIWRPDWLAQPCSSVRTPYNLLWK